MRRKLSFMLLLVFVLTLAMGGVSAFAAGATTVGAVPSAQPSGGSSTSVSSVPLLTVEDQKAATTMFTTLMNNGKSTDGTTLKVTMKPNSPTGTADGVLFKLGTNSIIFDKQVFDYSTNSSRKTALGDFVNGLQSSQISKQTQQNIIDSYSDLSPDVSRMLIPLVMDSTSADLFGAMKVINPFLPFIRLVFGIGAFIIFIFLIASTIVDLTFIGLPMARENLQNKGEQKGGKIPFVSSDAMSVVKETESALDSSGGYKNAYVLYFKRRVLTYIILSVCVLYLVVGELGGVIAWLLGLASGTISK